MFANIIEFKDTMLKAGGPTAAGDSLFRALKSDSYFLFGPDCFRQGICGAAEANLSHVATLLEPGKGFRECSAEIASGLLLFSGVQCYFFELLSVVLLYYSVFTQERKRCNFCATKRWQAKSILRTYCRWQCAMHRSCPNPAWLSWH